MVLNHRYMVSSSTASPSPTRCLQKASKAEKLNNSDLTAASKNFLYETFDQSDSSKKHSKTPRLPSSPQKSIIKKQNNSIYHKYQKVSLKTTDSPLKDDSSHGEFVQLREKVRNELMLGFNHYLMRTIKKSTRSDEYKVSGRYQDSTQLFSRLSSRMEKPETPMAPFRVKQNYGTGKLIHKKSTVQDKVLNQTTSGWISKHGKVSDSLSIKSNARIIFDMLDPGGKGEITGQQFCEFLIEIGFPLEIFTTFAFIKKYKHVQSIESIRLTADDIGNFCRADHRTDTLLSALYIALGELNIEKQGKIDIVTLFNVVKTWWSETDENNSHVIHCNVICEFLVKKGVTVDFNESFKLVSKCAIDGFVDFGHFQLIFVKGFVKHLLVNIQHKFKTEDWKNSDFSNAYKLCQLKKQLILAGISYPVPKISIEEGLAALNAMQKYATLIGRPIENLEYPQFCETWKKMTGEILGKTYMKSNLEEIQHRLVESPERTLNRFSLIGNTDVKFNVKKKWTHSVSPDCQLKDIIPVNRDERRFVNQNELLKEFSRLVKYEWGGTQE